MRVVQETYELEITFPLLADSQHTVIDRYGLLNMGTAHGPSTRRFATPATFILDKEGVVRWRMVEDNWKIRPTNEVIVAALARIKAGEQAFDLTLESVSAMENPALTKARLAAGEQGTTDNMVLVSSGPFSMGGQSDLGGDGRKHEVELDAYYIDKYEVTNGQYQVFLDYLKGRTDHSRRHPLEASGKDHTPRHWNDSRYNSVDFPVVGTDWFDAYGYCAWAGKSLPTEAQWEKAARGGVEDQAYPWGNRMDESKANMNTEFGAAHVVLQDLGEADPNTYPLENRGPKAVGSYAPNDIGLYDMIGNVEEWCWDWYDPDYYRQSPGRNPTGPEVGVQKVIRGGAWHHAYGRLGTRYTHRPHERGVFLGFRCVKAAPDGEEKK